MEQQQSYSPRTLQDLVPGQSGMILSVGNQSGAVKRRLVDMGLTPGTTVKVTKVAPLGDPLEVSLRGYELSLRKDDAAQIRIGAPRRPAAREAAAHRTDPERTRKQLQDHVHELEQHERPYDHSAHDSRPMRIALAGNPNCGKTTLFNALTGSNQYVGNWPGVTVEKKEGTARLGDRELTVVDLPGIYSRSPYSMEEIVARDFIIGEGPDAILNIVDATNLERNLYLTVQLLELERPLVLALNFMDEVEARGDSIDVEHLSRQLGVPVVPITAKTGQGLDELLEKIGGRLDTGACRVVLRLPYDQGGVVDMLHRQAKVERVDYGEAIEVEAVCTPVQLGRLKDYIVSGWTPPKEPWED